MSDRPEQARRELGRISLALALLNLPVAALAQGVGDASAWLARIQQAAVDSSYQGTLTFSAGGVVTSSRLEHYCDGRQRYERLEVLDGHARLQYRHNKNTHSTTSIKKTLKTQLDQSGPKNTQNHPSTQE